MSGEILLRRLMTTQTHTMRSSSRKWTTPSVRRMTLGISVAGDPQAAVVRALRASFVGVFFYDAPTPFGTASCIHVGPIHLDNSDAESHWGRREPWFAWIVITFMWQLLNAFVHGVLKRRHCRPLPRVASWRGSHHCPAPHFLASSR